MDASRLSPGQPWPLIDWRFVNRGDLPQLHFVFMTEDNISVKVESGDSLNLSPNEIEMVLTSNGKADRTVFRPWTSEWWIAKSSDNTLQLEVFGGLGDIPVPSK